ncbi:MAG: sigma-54 dependent transcriptional regulator [Thermoanaerobaculia bacterium]|nr:sigma-54 dependent transcriptional regulator [Thermoanaerobaculia bacterium]
MIGRSPTFVQEIQKIELVSTCDVGVLICGETGTGKELVARAIHYLSSRHKSSFLPVNCGAIPSELAENEFFGHSQGAFTGAGNARPGLVEEADRGTLFLDEVDSLPLLVQTKLLRFLQDGSYRRLGSTRERASDVRLIAATNTDIQEAVDRGKLRQDLYYRLNVVAINLPPLRDRPEDIPLLIRHFLHRYSQELKRPICEFDDEGMAALVQYDWPGNVRQLQHVVQRAVVLAGDCERIPWHDSLLPGNEESVEVEPFKQAKAKVVESFERSYVEKMLAAHYGNISRAAHAAKKNRRAFWELIRKHKIDVGRFAASL